MGDVGAVITRGGSPPSPRAADASPLPPSRLAPPYAVYLSGGQGVRSRAPLARSLRLAPRLASPLVSAVSLRRWLRAPLAAPAARPFALASVGWWRCALPSACGAGSEGGKVLHLAADPRRAAWLAYPPAG